MVIKYSLSDFDDEQLFSMCGITFTFIQDDGLRFKGTLDNCNTHRRPPRVLIDGDMRLPISLFKYIESEVDLFLMFKNDTPSQINEPSKLNWRDAKTELPYSGEIVIAKMAYPDGGHYCIDGKFEDGCWSCCGEGEEVIEWFYLYEMPFDMLKTTKLELYDKTVYNNIKDAQADGATSEIEIEGVTIESLKLIINAVSEVFGKGLNGIGTAIEVGIE